MIHGAHRSAADLCALEPGTHLVPSVVRRILHVTGISHDRLRIEP